MNRRGFLKGAAAVAAGPLVGLAGQTVPARSSVRFFDDPHAFLDPEWAAEVDGGTEEFFERFEYVRDGLSGYPDRVAEPSETYATGRGDCEDVVAVVGSFLLAADMSFRMVYGHDEEDGLSGHTYMTVAGRLIDHNGVRTIVSEEHMPSPMVVVEVFPDGTTETKVDKEAHRVLE